MLWFSKKQKSVALSSVEAEYMEANQASCEALWLCKLMVDLFDMELSPTVIQCDIIRVASNSPRIRYFMTGRSTLRLYITLLGIMFRQGLFNCSMFLQMSR